MTKILGTATLYFVIVFGVGFLLGPIRVLLLEPRIGAVRAALCEAPFLLGAILVASRVAPRTLQLEARKSALLAVGLIALGMQQIADLAVGLTFRSLSLTEQLARFATAEGAVYAALLALFATMPILANQASK
ncbi:hypothetical protein [Bradyrhizobium sp. LMTR 3]|uniref:hypothetical protein n=1 Tax=Bradyrhizobium sp. LMTR 3 TaxID=189873 RepID=UPI000810EB18|nr:hypothetical protein [Bradyrhizobium sp. LMTR 3]OCK62425.1 hypothetical protein LMTR3_04770 [Bradyrhizobium sp. LMTR 3]